MDCVGWRDAGLEISTTNNEAAKLLNQAVSELYQWNGDPLAAVQQALKVDPNFTMGHVFLTGLELLGTSQRPGHSKVLDEGFSALKASIVNQSLQPWEDLHVQAIQDFYRGDFYSASYKWEQILIDYPTDPISLRFVSDTYFYLGESNQIRDSVARVLPYWEKRRSHPLYGYVLGMYAFGLEESYDFRSAQKYAETALDINRTDCWATHAKVHVLEMEGRTSEGITFLESTVKDWERGGGLACHNYWHLALYYIEQEKLDIALDIFDKEINKRKDSGAPLDLVDASALLFRLEMKGVNVGDRWKGVYQVWTSQQDNHLTAFNDAHIAMSLSEEEIDSWFNSLATYLKDENLKYSTNHQITNEIGYAICQAIIDYKRGNYSQVVKKLNHLRHKIWRIGGSHAQRDIFHQMILQAAIRSPEPHDWALAQHLINERLALKPNGHLTKSFLDQLHQKTE